MKILWLMMIWLAGAPCVFGVDFHIGVIGNSSNAECVAIYNAALIAAEEKQDIAAHGKPGVVFIQEGEGAAEAIRGHGVKAVMGLINEKHAELMGAFPEMPFVSLSSDFAGLTRNPNAFRAIISNSQMARALCRADIKIFGRGSFAVVWEEGNSEYESIAKAYADTVIDNGARLLYQRSVAPDRDDYNAILIRIRELKAQVVFYAGSMEQAVKIAKQAKELNVGAVFTFTDNIHSKRFIKATGAAAEGVQFVTKFHVSPYSFKGSRQFLGTYKKRFGWPSGYVPFAYDAANMLIQLVAAESTPAEALKGVTHRGLTAVISFDGAREMREPAFFLYIIRKQEFLHFRFAQQHRDAYNTAK